MATDDERFWAKVDRGADGCWEWTGARIPEGYGSFAVCRQGGGHQQVGAHRWAYERLVGEIPTGLVIDHLCRNRACVNPTHLEAVTNQVNVQRGVPFLRRRPTCPQGHDFTDENTYRTPRGHRQCRKCTRARVSANYAKRKAAR